MGDIQVEVAYATEEKQMIVPVKLAEGGTVEQAIQASGISEHFEDIEITDVGVFSKRKKMQDVLQAGDRVEIYRPLIADPKAVRRKRAAEVEAKKKEG